jgi:hypothetical protein
MGAWRPLFLGSCGSAWKPPRAGTCPRPIRTSTAKRALYALLRFLARLEFRRGEASEGRRSCFCGTFGRRPGPHRARGRPHRSARRSAALLLGANCLRRTFTESSCGAELTELQSTKSRALMPARTQRTRTSARAANSLRSHVRAPPRTLRNPARSKRGSRALPPPRCLRRAVFAAELSARRRRRRLAFG